MEQQTEEEKELQLLDHNKLRNQQPLQHPNQHLPAKTLRENHRYQYGRLQLAKTRMQLSLFVVAFCAAGYIGLLIWSSMAMPAGSMSSYASPFAGGFPRDFGVIVGGLAFFLLLAITFLEKINPDIARKLKEEYRKTV